MERTFLHGRICIRRPAQGCSYESFSVRRDCLWEGRRCALFRKNQDEEA